MRFFVGDAASITTIDAEAIRCYARQLLGERRRKPTTVRRRLASF
jgi:hypothetical protein